MPARGGAVELGKNVGLDLIQQLCRIDQQDHSTLRVQVRDAADQAHLLRPTAPATDESRPTGTLMTLRYLIDQKPGFSAVHCQDKNASAAGLFLRRKLKTPAEIDDRNNAATKVYHPVDERGRPGKSGNRGPADA